MNDETKLLLRWLRNSEMVLAGLRTSEDSPFRDAARRLMQEDIVYVKAKVFDAMRETIEAMEGGR